MDDAKRVEILKQLEEIYNELKKLKDMLLDLAWEVTSE